MPWHQNVGGTWKSLVWWENVGGTWKKIAWWNNVSGVWKKITTLFNAVLPPGFTTLVTTISQADSTASLTLSAAGTYSGTSGIGSGTWIDGGSGTDYEARMSVVSGSLTFGTVGSWVSLGSDRVWRVTTTFNGFQSNTFTGTLEIRLAAAPNTVLASSNVSLTAAVEL